MKILFKLDFLNIFFPQWPRFLRIYPNIIKNESKAKRFDKKKILCFIKIAIKSFEYKIPCVSDRSMRRHTDGYSEL